MNCKLTMGGNDIAAHSGFLPRWPWKEIPAGHGNKVTLKKVLTMHEFLLSSFTEKSDLIKKRLI